jgi:hypothetical protein
VRLKSPPLASSKALGRRTGAHWNNIFVPSSFYTNFVSNFDRQARGRPRFLRSFSARIGFVSALDRVRDSTSQAGYVVYVAPSAAIMISPCVLRFVARVAKLGGIALFLSTHIAAQTTFSEHG